MPQLGQYFDAEFSAESQNGHLSDCASIMSPQFLQYFFVGSFLRGSLLILNWFSALLAEEAEGAEGAVGVVGSVGAVGVVTGGGTICSTSGMGGTTISGAGSLAIVFLRLMDCVKSHPQLTHCESPGRQK